MRYMPRENEKKSIENLRRNVDKLRTARTVDETSLSEIKKSVDDIEVELHHKDAQVGELTNNLNKVVSEKAVVEQEKNSLSSKIDGLLKEKAELEENIRILQQQRPQIPSENLVTTFRQSLDNMAGKLNEPEARANYVISSMNVKLKTNLSLKDDILQFQLPKPDDIISPENLSTIEFTIKSSPKELDLSQHLEVPDLRGMTRYEAENAITNAGFKLGDVNEKPSNSPQGTVIDQLPSANSLAIPGSAIDITTSKVTHVETPNLVGLDIDSAREVLENSQLKMGEVTETPSKSTPGTVLKQSIEAGAMVLIGTTVDVEVAREDTAELISADKDIELIEGIGPERGSKLRDAGIRTIKELANADPTTVIEAVGENTAEKTISMAKLIDSTSNLEDLGIDRQSAELLVKAGNIHSIDELKNADPHHLYELCKEAVESGKVKVPASYSIKQEDVKRWIEQAQ